MTITQAAHPDPPARISPRGAGEPEGGPGRSRVRLELLGLVQRYVESLADVLPWASHDRRALLRAVELTDDLEIWAIHWPKDQGLELHDHGGHRPAPCGWSTGALRGTLAGPGGGLIAPPSESGGVGLRPHLYPRRGEHR